MKYLIFLFFLLNLICKGGNAQQVPFTIELEQVNAGNLPGLHSFAFAQSGSKWLFAGGRTNGLHGFSTNDNFPIDYANTDIVVVDTATWTYSTAPLIQLALPIADALRSTNMQSVQIGDYLYVVGGFGWDSTLGQYTTFPTLTALHVNNLINAVETGTSITSHIRQITDTLLQVSGGELVESNGECFLFFGHNFYGRYSDPPIPTFTQVYTEQIRRFTIVDNGVNLSLANTSSIINTNHFHRRDLNVGPIIRADGSEGWTAWSGVFQKTADLPYTYPVTYSTQNGLSVDTGFHQLMNNYTCPILPIFDSIQGTMYTVFFGGMSLYYWDSVSNQLNRDSLIPFVKDISVVIRDAAGTYQQIRLPITMPGLKGTNMRFIPVETAPFSSNHVLRLRSTTGRQLVGYLYGGIAANAPNRPNTTWANDTVYRVYLTPDLNLLGISESSRAEAYSIFPNPANERLILRNATSLPATAIITDANGRIVHKIQVMALQDTVVQTQLWSSGVYHVRITGNDFVSQKITIFH